MKIIKKCFKYLLISAEYSESYIKRTTNDYRFSIYSGENWKKGAYIVLRSIGISDHPGSFELGAHDGTISSALCGFPDGRLILDVINNSSNINYDVLSGVITAGSKTINGYITLHYGIILQWGQDNSALGLKTIPITFPIKFSSSTFTAVAIKMSSETTDAPYIISAKYITNGSVTFHTNYDVLNGNSWYIRWFVIGY